MRSLFWYGEIKGLSESDVSHYITTKYWQRRWIKSLIRQLSSNTAPIVSDNYFLAAKWTVHAKLDCCGILPNLYNLWYWFNSYFDLFHRVLHKRCKIKVAFCHPTVDNFKPGPLAL